MGLAADMALLAATLSAGATLVQVSRRVRRRAGSLQVSHSPHAASTVLAVRDFEPTAFGTTATVTVATVTRGCMAGSTIRTGGGILVRRTTRNSNTKLAWRMR